MKGTRKEQAREEEHGNKNISGRMTQLTSCRMRNIMGHEQEQEQERDLGQEQKQDQELKHEQEQEGQGPEQRGA